MTDRLFHLMPPAEAAAFLAGEGPWRPPSLEQEGFVHLSFAHQLAGTLAVHYPSRERMVLLELDAWRVAPDLRLEPSRGGALFPHLYRPVERSDVARDWELRRTPTGWDVPV